MGRRGVVGWARGETGSKKGGGKIAGAGKMERAIKRGKEETENANRVKYASRRKGAKG